MNFKNRVSISEFKGKKVSIIFLHICEKKNYVNVTKFAKDG